MTLTIAQARALENLRNAGTILWTLESLRENKVNGNALNSLIKKGLVTEGTREITVKLRNGETWTGTVRSVTAK